MMGGMGDGWEWRWAMEREIGAANNSQKLKIWKVVFISFVLYESFYNPDFMIIIKWE